MPLIQLIFNLLWEGTIDKLYKDYVFLTKLWQRPILTLVWIDKVGQIALLSKSSCGTIFILWATFAVRTWLFHISSQKFLNRHKKLKDHKLTHQNSNQVADATNLSNLQLTFAQTTLHQKIGAVIDILSLVSRCPCKEQTFAWGLNNLPCKEEVKT